MKQVTSMSRLTNQLEKMFRLLNQDFFDGVLDTPIITVVPSSRSYAHYTPWSAWQSKDTFRRESNIASGTLDRPLEAVTASLLHEMVHMYNDLVLNVQDCSRGGTYHSKVFKQQAEAHGLHCTRTEKYGWSHTEPTDELLEWLLLHDDLREIEMCRVNPGHTPVGIGAHTGNGISGLVATPTVKQHNFRYQCPCCQAIARSGKPVHLICGDCLQPMI